MVHFEERQFLDKKYCILPLSTCDSLLNQYDNVLVIAKLLIEDLLEINQRNDICLVTIEHRLIYESVMSIITNKYFITNTQAPKYGYPTGEILKFNPNIHNIFNHADPAYNLEFPINYVSTSTNVPNYVGE